MTKMCPSYRCGEDALLIGIVQADATVAFATTPIAVGPEFIEAAGLHPEARFRFAGTCVEQNCAQWKHGKCGIPNRVRKSLGGQDLPDPAPACAIRDECRWFAQESYDACRLCPLVTTHSTA